MRKTIIFLVPLIHQLATVKAVPALELESGRSSTGHETEVSSPHSIKIEAPSLAGHLKQSIDFEDKLEHFMDQFLGEDAVDIGQVDTGLKEDPEFHRKLIEDGYARCDMLEEIFETWNSRPKWTSEPDVGRGRFDYLDQNGLEVHSLPDDGLIFLATQLILLVETTSDMTPFTVREDLRIQYLFGESTLERLRHLTGKVIESILNDSPHVSQLETRLEYLRTALDIDMFSGLAMAVQEEILSHLLLFMNDWHGPHRQLILQYLLDYGIQLRATDEGFIDRVLNAILGTENLADGSEDVADHGNKLASIIFDNLPPSYPLSATLSQICWNVWSTRDFDFDTLQPRLQFILGQIQLPRAKHLPHLLTEHDFLRRLYREAWSFRGRRNPNRLKKLLYLSQQVKWTVNGFLTVILNPCFDRARRLAGKNRFVSDAHTNWISLQLAGLPNIFRLEWPETGKWGDLPTVSLKQGINPHDTPAWIPWDYQLEDMSEEMIWTMHHLRAGSLTSEDLHSKILDKFRAEVDSRNVPKLVALLQYQRITPDENQLVQKVTDIKLFRPDELFTFWENGEQINLDWWLALSYYWKSELDFTKRNEAVYREDHGKLLNVLRRRSETASRLNAKLWTTETIKQANKLLTGHEVTVAGLRGLRRLEEFSTFSQVDNLRDAVHHAIDEYAKQFGDRGTPSSRKAEEAMVENVPVKINFSRFRVNQ